TERLAALVSYWKAQLAGIPEVLELPADRARPPVESFRGAALPYTVDKAVVDGLTAIGRSQNVSLFMVVLTAFGAMLSRHTSVADTVIGCPISRRSCGDFDDSMGLFVDTAAGEIGRA